MFFPLPLSFSFFFIEYSPFCYNSSHHYLYHGHFQMMMMLHDYLKLLDLKFKSHGSSSSSSTTQDNCATFCNRDRRLWVLGCLLEDFIPKIVQNSPPASTKTSSRQNVFEPRSAPHQRHTPHKNRTPTDCYKIELYIIKFNAPNKNSSTEQHINPNTTAVIKFKTISE